ncbi:GNAT family N-acetyltransferase [Undibacterium sp. Jales W-56]|uniref:GNAT family N-acetyltransferase n=1 Tax=Undibacterium sp. Jales W-56 TaxID=2897325 RepID=UPI0021D1F828|nr:GNAT family N-acetyltransferase [Undibacterium sp. Jales W-56]MCU6434282.1 GNAT family N-acetyltransferase [Undibacterium sp. Jales W-56]
MKYSLIHAKELDASLIARWNLLRVSSAQYQSPYYHPTFTQIAARLRDDTRMVVCEDAGQVVGFLPFHRVDSMQARPVGLFLSDYQGPVTAPEVQLPSQPLLRAMGVRYLGFDHMPQARQDFAPYAWQHSRSQVLDLDGGFEAYAGRLAALHKVKQAGVLKTIRQMERKLSRERGELRFTMQSVSDQDYEQLLQGKSAQYIRTLGAARDTFAIPWVRQMLEQIRAHNTADFGGLLSTLHVGDELIAAHFGMRAGKVLHFWFPWYRLDYAVYSAGLILLKECASHAQELGLSLIDLGRGEQAYKTRFATSTVALCEGAISNPALLRQAQHAYLRTRRALRDSSLGQKIRAYKNKSDHHQS